MLGEPEMFARACWKIVALQVQAGRCEKLFDGRWAMRGESHDFLLLVFLDRFDRRADFGFVWSGTLVETAKSLTSEFTSCHEYMVTMLRRRVGDIRWMRT